MSKQTSRNTTTRKRRSFWEPDSPVAREWLDNQAQLGLSLHVVIGLAIERYGMGDVNEAFLRERVESADVTVPTAPVTPVKSMPKKSTPEQIPEQSTPEQEPEQEPEQVAVYTPEPQAQVPTGAVTYHKASSEQEQGTTQPVQPVQPEPVQQTPEPPKSSKPLSMADIMNAPEPQENNDSNDDSDPIDPIKTMMADMGSRMS